MRILLIEGDDVIRGEPLVGALADLGVNPSTFEWELAKLNIGDFHLHFEREYGPGRAGVAFTVHPGATHDEHVHAHGHADEDGHEHLHAHAHRPGHHDASEPSPVQAGEHPIHPAGQPAPGEVGPDFATPLGALNFAGLRELVEHSELSDRSKSLSLGLLADLEAFASPGGRPPAVVSGALSEPELSLLAQVVLLAVGIDQLRVDQVEVTRTDARKGPLPETSAAGNAPSLDPLIVALRNRLPRTGSLDGLQRLRAGVGVSAPDAGHPPAWVEALLLEG